MKPYWEESAKKPAAVSTGGNTFEVRYDARSFTGESISNADLSGKGECVVSADRQLIKFTGKERKTLFAGPKELEFAPADITDVVVEKATVRFTTTRGASGANHRPFYFYCKDSVAAMELAALLPATRRPDGEIAFAEKLKNLPGARHPLASVTSLLILANVAVFLALGFRYGAEFWTGKNAEPFLDFGANNGAAFAEGQWWRVLTSMFMHYGFWHLLFNMWALAKAGQLLEKLLGRPLFALVYLASGVGGGLASVWWYGDKVWSAGASGAIFGLYGALLGVLARLQREIPAVVLRPIVTSTIFFAGYNLLQGASHAGIDNACHVGGFLTGLVLGAGVALPLDLPTRAKHHASRLVLAAAGLAVIAVLGTLAAPKFDYRVSEELAFSRLVKPLAEEEKQFDSRMRKTAEDFDRGQVAIEAFTREADSYIDFAVRSLAAVRALHLTPGSRTETARTKLIEGLEKKEATGRSILKLGEEIAAVSAMSAEFERQLGVLNAKLRGSAVGPQGNENALRVVREDLVPFYDQWEKKCGELAVTTAQGITARNQLLGTIADRAKPSREAVKQATAETDWDAFITPYLKASTALNDRYLALQTNPKDAVKFIEENYLPFLVPWRSKVLAFETVNQSVAREKDETFKDINRKIFDLNAQKARIGSDQTRQTAAQLKALESELQALSRRISRDVNLVLSAPLRTVAGMHERFETDYLPACTALKEKAAALDFSDPEFASAGRDLRERIEEYRDRVAKGLVMSENAARLVQVGERIDREKAEVDQRVAEARQKKSLTSQTRSKLATEVTATYAKWKKEIGEVALTDEFIISGRNKVLEQLDTDLRAALELIAQLPVK